MIKFLSIIAILIVGFIGWRFYEKHAAVRMLNSYSDTVKAATNDAFSKLSLPAATKDEDKANVAGQLMMCLNMCLTTGEKLSFVVQSQNCEALCLCLVNGSMQAMPWDQFLGKNQTPENANKGAQIFRSCLAQYKK